MTEIEAIKRIKECKNTPNFQPYTYMNEALNMAIKALEKQIPKKPVRQVRRSIEHEYKDYYCSCGNFIGYETPINKSLEMVKIPFKYCPDCGQKLDWGDEK